MTLQMYKMLTRFAAYNPPAAGRSRSGVIIIIHSISGKSDSADTVLNTTHQNQIPGIQIQEGDKSSAQVVSTIASDGLLVSWNLGNLESLMNGLTL